MFRNLKFAMKIGGGFALLLVLCAFVAAMGFVGLRQVRASIAGMTAAKDVTISILEARREEKNFIIRGGRSYIDLVAAAVKRLDQATSTLQASPLNASQKKLVNGIAQANRDYETAFSSYVTVFDAVGDRAAEWKTLGDQLVGDLKDANAELEKAFLLLRVTAIYFLKDRTPERLKDLNAAAQASAPLIGTWAAKSPDRQGAAARFKAYVASANDMSDLYAKQASLDSRLVESGRAVIDNSAKLEAGLQAEMNRTAALSTLLILVSAAGALVLGVLAAFLLTGAVTGPVRKVVSYAARIASGDFSSTLVLDQRDEMGLLAEALTDVSVKLRSVVSTIQESATQVASSSEQITASAQQLAEGAQSQASTLEQTSASVEELTASVDQVAEHAQSQAAAVEQGSSSMAQVHQSIQEVSKNLEQIAGLAGRSVENALEGAKAVSQVVDGIELIAGSSEKIGGIITVISDIADQTNLLALNASIEAARAGEHGRGFAVVAEEVSKLADRSSSSTKEIETLIRESTRNVTRGVETAKGSQVAMEQIRAASQKVKDMIGDLSSSMTQQVGAVKELSGALSSVSEMSQSISAATEEQTSNAKQVAKAVETVNEVTQGAASASEQMSAATEQLASMAQELMKLTAQFKIEGQETGKVSGRKNGNGSSTSVEGPAARTALLEKGSLDLAQIDQALAAHGAWKSQLREAIRSGHSETPVETARADDACEFGRWFYRLTAAERETGRAREVQELHAEFHRTAADILQKALSGGRPEAERSLAGGGEFAQITAKLTFALIGWKSSIGGPART